MKHFYIFVLLALTSNIYSQQTSYVQEYTLDFVLKFNNDSSTYYVSYTANMESIGGATKWNNIILKDDFLQVLDSASMKEQLISLSDVKIMRLSSRNDDIFRALLDEGFIIKVDPSIKRELNRRIKNPIPQAIKITSDRTVQENLEYRIQRYAELRQIGKILEAGALGTTTTSGILGVVGAIKGVSLISPEGMATLVIVGGVLYLSAWLIDWSAVKHLRANSVYSPKK